MPFVSREEKNFQIGPLPALSRCFFAVSSAEATAKRATQLEKQIGVHGGHRRRMGSSPWALEWISVGLIEASGQH